MKGNITLQEGLDKFYEKNRKYFSERSISAEGEEFLKCHDIAHVLFDCDTSICGEGVVKIWTTFGTTLSFWKVVSGYNEAGAFELFRMYSFRSNSRSTKSPCCKNICMIMGSFSLAVGPTKRLFTGTSRL